jgi:hypothetical protein
MGPSLREIRALVSAAGYIPTILSWRGRVISSRKHSYYSIMVWQSYQQPETFLLFYHGVAKKKIQAHENIARWHVSSRSVTLSVDR